MPQPDITIRPASNRDWESACNLIAQLGYANIDREQFRRVYISVLGQPGTLVLVAENPSGTLIGLESVSLRPQIRLAGLLATIDELVVAESARGIGVGKALLREAITLARKLARSSNLPLRLQLETYRSRESYIRHFYVKNGFTEADSAIMRLSDRDGFRSVDGLSPDTQTKQPAHVTLPGG